MNASEGCRWDWLAIAWCAGLVLLQVWHSFGPPLYAPMTDFFHEGEFLAGLPQLRRGANIPVLIHGPGRDLLPVALAEFFALPGQLIAFVRLFNATTNMLTLLALGMTAFVLVYAMARDTQHHPRRLAAASLVGHAVNCVTHS